MTDILNTPESHAGFVVRMGYVQTAEDQHKLRADLMAEFAIDEDRARTVVNKAIAEHAATQAALEAAIRADEDAAIAAEHDLNTSMHPTEGG